jgi:hypothetical protein
MGWSIDRGNEKTVVTTVVIIIVEDIATARQVLSPLEPKSGVSVAKCRCSLSQTLMPLADLSFALQNKYLLLIDAFCDGFKFVRTVYLFNDKTQAQEHFLGLCGIQIAQL